MVLGMHGEAALARLGVLQRHEPRGRRARLVPVAQVHAHHVVLAPHVAQRRQEALVEEVRDHEDHRAPRQHAPVRREPR